MFNIHHTTGKNVIATMQFYNHELVMVYINYNKAYGIYIHKTNPLFLNLNIPEYKLTVLGGGKTWSII